MNQRMCRTVVALVALVVATACTKSNSAGPSPSIGAPLPLTPANGAAIKNADQPVTLIVQNAAISTPTGCNHLHVRGRERRGVLLTKMQTKAG